MIFVVLADPGPKEDIDSALRDDGYAARFFPSADPFLRQADHQAPDLVILDESLAIVDGRSVIEIYQERFPRRATPFLQLSDSPAIDAANSLAPPGASRRISKSAGGETLRETLASMLGYLPGRPRSDGDPPSDSQRGKLSGIRVGDRTFHVQTEAQGRDASQISTVVVLDGQVRFKKTTDATAEDIARKVEAQHEAVEKQIRGKLEVIQNSKTPAAAELPSKWDLLKMASTRVKADDFDGALEVLDEARRYYPDDPRWEINLRLVKRKMSEQESRKIA